ncbi:MAG: hypothetical protein PHG47_01840 [Sulfuricella sp.]|nr:hypothetical protein [Sulfuricella sp.]
MQPGNKPLSGHILPTSATMVGVCMTVISIVKLSHVGVAGVLIDKILAFDSLLFLSSAIFSYLSLRVERNAVRMEGFADNFFMVGLVFMTAAAFVLSFELF